MRQYVPAGNELARSHLLEAGYWPVYSYFRMRMDLADAAPPPADVPVRPFSRGPDDAPVHALVEEAMAGVPGNEPRSLESWQAAKIDKEGWDPSLWLLHEEAAGLAGVVLGERWEDGVGYIDYLAVAAHRRGHGLGRALLLHGLAGPPRRRARPSPSSRCRARTPRRRGSTSRSACVRSGRSSAGRNRSARCERYRRCMTNGWPENPEDPVDPAFAPLIEAGEGESEGFELAEADLIDHASHGDQHTTQPIMRDEIELAETYDDPEDGAEADDENKDW